MSHTMNIELELHDMDALTEACNKLGLQMKSGVHKLYSTEEEGIAIQLNGWQYPVVVKSDGTIAYDNYNGRWGDISKLYELKAHYGLEKAKIEARKKGYSFYESYNPVTREIELHIRL